MTTKKEIDQYCDVIRQTAYELYRHLGSGHLEKIYENGLIHRLSKKGFTVQQQLPISVHDEDGTIIGDLKADLMINDTLLIECKAVEQTLSVHSAQLLGYLRATKLEYGLLINFGGARFYIKRYAYTQKNPSLDPCFRTGL